MNPTDEEFSERVDNVFKHDDDDKDGLISFDEFSGPKHDEL